MKRCGEIIFLVFLSTLFILNPVLSFGAEKKQESVTINEQDMQKYLQTFKGVIVKYMDELEKQGIEVDREKVEKELNNLLQIKGPLELNEKELNEYIEKNKGKINEMIKDIMSKDPNQLGGNLGNIFRRGGDNNTADTQRSGLLGGLGGGLLGGLGGGGTDAVSNGSTNMGAPGQIDRLINTFGRVFGGLYEGTILGAPLGSALGIALGFALDAGISIAEIIGLAVLVGGVLAILAGIALFLPGILVGAIIGAIIFTLLTMIVIYLVVGSGTFLVVFFILFFLPIINIITAAIIAIILSSLFVIFALLPGIIVGGIVGGILGLAIAPVGAILGFVGGGLIGGMAGAGLAITEQFIFIPMILLFGLIGLVIGVPSLAMMDSLLGLLAFSGRSVFSTAVKSVESYGGDYINHIDSIAMDIINSAKESLGPKSYNILERLEIIIDNADLKTPKGINKANEQILQMLPAMVQ